MALHNLKQFFQSSGREARRRSREIDATLKREQRKPVMMLLMGWHRGGMSTFFKQMRIINGAEFNHNELLKFRGAIYRNIILGMTVIIQERTKLGIPLQNNTNEMHETLIKSCDLHLNLEPSTFQPYVGAVDSLWKDSGIQEAHLRRSDFTLYESVKYFFDNIHRIGQLNYLPNNQDILYIHEYFSTRAERYFVLRDSPFGIADISSRHCLRLIIRFYDKNPVLYFVGSSDYDDCDGSNYMEENGLAGSLKNFECLCNNRVFLFSPIILFFNKMDLLAEKIQTTDIRKYFPEFQGDPHKLEDVQEYLVQIFKEKKPEGTTVFYHMITAVDTDNIRTVFSKVKDTVMGRNLEEIPVL